MGHVSDKTSNIRSLIVVSIVSLVDVVFNFNCLLEPVSSWVLLCHTSHSQYVENRESMMKARKQIIYLHTKTHIHGLLSTKTAKKLTQTQYPIPSCCKILVVIITRKSPFGATTSLLMHTEHMVTLLPNIHAVLYESAMNLDLLIG